MYYAHTFFLEDVGMYSVIINTASTYQKLLATQEGQEVSREAETRYLGTYSLRTPFCSFLRTGRRLPIDPDKRAQWDLIKPLLKTQEGLEAVATLLAAATKFGCDL